MCENCRRKRSGNSGLIHSILDNPHVVRVVDCGETDTGKPRWEVLLDGDSSVYIDEKFMLKLAKRGFYVNSIHIVEGKTISNSLIISQI